MEEILQSLNLGNLSHRFGVERIEPETALAASDQQLIHLGVGTIGDRIRLRDACKKKIAESASSSSSQATAVRDERLALFNPRRNSNRTQTRVAARSGASKRKSSRGNAWTPTFICMADSVSCKTPSSIEKQLLFKAGLGVKKIKLDMDDDEQAVISKITSEAKNPSGDAAIGFPQLKICGGFEMMRCAPNCRDLTIIDSSWCAKDLRSNLGGGQGKIYLRPIQKALSTKPLQQQSESAVKEKCYMCNQEVLVRKLREHLWACTDALNSEEDEENNTIGYSNGSSTSTSISTSEIGRAHV